MTRINIKTALALVAFILVAGMARADECTSKTTVSDGPNGTTIISTKTICVK